MAEAEFDTPPNPNDKKNQETINKHNEMLERAAEALQAYEAAQTSAPLPQPFGGTARWHDNPKTGEKQLLQEFELDLDDNPETTEAEVTIATGETGENATVIIETKHGFDLQNATQDVFIAVDSVRNPFEIDNPPGQNDTGTDITITGSRDEESGIFSWSVNAAYDDVSIDKVETPAIRDIERFKISADEPTR